MVILSDYLLNTLIPQSWAAFSQRGFFGSGEQTHNCQMLRMETECSVPYGLSILTAPPARLKEHSGNEDEKDTKPKVGEE